VERLDPDPECDGLAPERIPEPVTARVENPGGRCLGGISDGTGHVAVAIAPGLPWNRAQVFSPAGAALARFNVWGEVAPQPDGWIIAFSRHEHTCRFLSFSYGVYPMMMDNKGESWHILVVGTLNELRLVKKDDKIIIAEGRFHDHSGGTDSLEILTI
jgi:hypothetical protein